MKNLYGVTTAMVTPFNEKEEIDLNAIDELVEFLIRKGVHCIYPLGTTGEMLKLSIEERKLVAERIVHTVAGRVTVFIHVGANSLQETKELAKHAYDIKADGIGVVTPQFFVTTNREMEEYFVNVASSLPASFPMYLYSIPQNASNDITPEVAQNIANRCKNVIGIKYSYPDFLRISDYLRINNGQFSVLPGTDSLFLAGLAMGCDGVVSGNSCVYPEPFVDTYKAFEKKDFIEARKMQLCAVQYSEELRGGSNLSFFKEGLKWRGINVGGVREPQLNITSEEREVLNSKLSELDKAYSRTE